MSAEEAAKIYSVGRTEVNDQSTRKWMECGKRDEMEERRSLSLKEVLDSWHGK